MQYRSLVSAIITLLVVSYSTRPAYSISFKLPDPDIQIVGELKWIQALDKDNFNNIGRRYGLGYHEIMEANPGVKSTDIEAGTIIVLPTRFILPSNKRKGILINLAELRLYYYTANKVYTYPIGIGREDWDTPLGPSRIIQKLKNPTWYVPRAIREASKKDGIILPERVPPGQDNPLGPYALRLHYHNYLIHGTNDIEGVGRRSTAGCLRMFPEDAKQLFEQVSINTPVNIIDQPYKAGWNANQELYLEAHLPLHVTEPDSPETQKTLTKIISTATRRKKIAIAWEIAQTIIRETSGIPQKISIIPKPLCAA
jgi:L,D-transpeptidase ErfK/SrfK